MHWKKRITSLVAGILVVSGAFLVSLGFSGPVRGEIVDFSHLVEDVQDGVVSVVAVQMPNDPAGNDSGQRIPGMPLDEFFRNFFDRNMRPNRKVHVTGSGFIILADKETVYVVTNNHIVENASKAKIFLSDKTEIPASVHGIDPRSDLAVLKVMLQDIPKDKRNRVKALSWGDSDAARVGHWVVAIGNPFGLGNTVTHGIISAKARDLHIVGNSLADEFIQHSAQINVGNSGGCLLNTRGEVIGINTLIITPSSGNVGIGFAIPSNVAKSVITKLIKHKRISRGALGVQVQDFTRDMADGLNVKNYMGGAIISLVEPKGPAAKAGLKVGDVIVGFDNAKVINSSKLSHAVGDAEQGTKHTVTVIRERKEISVPVVLADFDALNNVTDKLDKSSGATREVLGMTVIDSALAPANAKEPGYEKPGAFVLKIEPDSPAEEAGLMRGDVIEEVCQRPVRSADELVKEVQAAKGKGALYVQARRAGRPFFTAIKFEGDKPIEPKEEKGSKEAQTSPVDKIFNEKQSAKADKEAGAEPEQSAEAPVKEGDAVVAPPEALSPFANTPQQPPVEAQEPNVAPGNDQPNPEMHPGVWGRVKRALKHFRGLFGGSTSTGDGASGFYH